MKKNLKVECRERILWVAIDRAEKRNALNEATFMELRDVFSRYAGDDTLLAAVLTGEGNRAFAAGGDLRELQAFTTDELIRRMTQLSCDALAAIRAFPVPVIAALNGDALGGGAELALACDFRFAAPQARIGFLQGTLAVPPAWGGSDDLIQLLGAPRALELMASCRLLDAKEARALQLVEEIASETESFTEAVDDWLTPWKQRHPQVMRALKAAVRVRREGGPAIERAAHNFNNFITCWLHSDHFEAAERKLATLGSRRSAP